VQVRVRVQVQVQVQSRVKVKVKVRVPEQACWVRPRVTVNRQPSTVDREPETISSKWNRGNPPGLPHFLTYV